MRVFIYTNLWIYSLEINEISILKLSENGKEYIKYAEIMKFFMYEKIKKLKILLKEKIIFCPLECIFLHYMLDIKQNGIYAITNIIDIYNILDLYAHTFNNNLIGHEKYLCKKYFCKSKKELTIKEQKLNDYLIGHYEKMMIVPTIINNFNNKYKEINWLTNHYINFGGSNNDFKYNHKIDLIGNNKEYVFIGYINPQFSELNINDILINSIMDTFIIENIKQHQEKD